MQAAAESLAAEYGVTYIGVAGRTRSPGRMVVDAAIEHEAALIVIGAPDKPRRGAQPSRRSSSAAPSTSSCARRRAG